MPIEMTLGPMIFWSVQSYSAIFLNLWWWWLTPVVHLGLDEVGNPRLRTQA